MSCTPNPVKIECQDEIIKLEADLNELIESSEVKIKSVVFKEEIYFPAIIAMQIEFINPITQTLDFNKLDSIEYKRFDNYEEIQHKLKSEGEEVVRLIDENCNLQEFTSIMVKFTREVGKLNYSFLCHYELIDYIKNHKKRINY